MGTMCCPANDLLSPSRPTGQVSRRPDHHTQCRTAGREAGDREARTEGRGLSLISREARQATAPCLLQPMPILRIDNRDMRTRTRIHFDNRFFDYRLTCLNCVLEAVLLMPR